jgi:hypothetical protein
MKELLDLVLTPQMQMTCEMVVVDCFPTYFDNGRVYVGQVKVYFPEEGQLVLVIINTPQVILDILREMQSRDRWCVTYKLPL